MTTTNGTKSHKQRSAANLAGSLFTAISGLEARLMVAKLKVVAIEAELKDKLESAPPDVRKLAEAMRASLTPAPQPEPAAKGEKRAGSSA